MRTSWQSFSFITAGFQAHTCYFSPLRANPIKWRNTLKKSVGNKRRVVKQKKPKKTRKSSPGDFTNFFSAVIMKSICEQEGYLRPRNHLRSKCFRKKQHLAVKYFRKKDFITGVSQGFK